MKHLIAGTLIGFICGGLCIAIGYKIRVNIEDRQNFGTVYELQKMPMPEEYRQATGYDSLQYYYFGDELKVNFCYPNNLSASDSDILVGNYPIYSYIDSVELKPKPKRKPKKKITVDILTGRNLHAGNIPIGRSSLSNNTTGSGMFMYHGENNPANDTLCKYEGHTIQRPFCVDPTLYNSDSCYRCGKPKIDTNNYTIPTYPITIEGSMIVIDTMIVWPTPLTETTKSYLNTPFGHNLSTKEWSPCNYGGNCSIHLGHKLLRDLLKEDK